MIAFTFDYYRPTTLDEALNLLTNEGFYPQLGGTDLIVKMRNKALKPKAVVDLKAIKELHFVKFSKEEGLEIGAAVTLNEVVAVPEVAKYYPTFHQGVRSIGAYQTRNRGTVAGNIGNSSPAADSVPGLLTHNAKLRLVSKSGERIVELKDFFTGPGKNVRQQGEIIYSIIVPFEGEAIGRYYKIGRSRGFDLSTIGAALTVINPSGNRDIRVALASVAPTPVRAFEAEEFIKGKELTPENVEEFCNLVQKSTSPITDARGTKEYRYEMAKVLPRKLLRELGLFKEAI